MAWRDRERALDFVFLGDGRVEDEKGRDAENYDEKLGLRELRMRVNLASPILQARVPIRGVISPIRDLSNPMMQLVPLISHIRSYPPDWSHLHPPSLSFSSTTLLSLQNIKSGHLSVSLHGMIVSWHRLQCTPSAASTQDCLSSLHSRDYELTPECGFSFWRAFLHNRPPLASSPQVLQGNGTLSQSHSWESTNWWMESQHPVHRPSTASEYSSNLTRSQPSKCITNLARLRPPSSHDHGLQSASWSSLDHRLEVYLQCRSIAASHFRTIMASTCISKLARSRSRSASLCPLNQCLQVYLQIRSITACKCISKLAGSWPRSVSLSSLDRQFQAVLKFLWCTTCSESRYNVCRWEAI